MQFRALLECKNEYSPPSTLFTLKDVPTPAGAGEGLFIGGCMSDIVIAPQAGKQELVLEMCQEVDFLIMGGSRFGGKSTLASMIPLMFKDDPFYNAIVFRRHYSELMGAGS